METETNHNRCVLSPDISWPTLCQHVSPQALTVTALLEIRLTGP